MEDSAITSIMPRCQIDVDHGVMLTFEYEANPEGDVFVSMEAF